MTEPVPRYINQGQSGLRGVTEGWYVMDERFQRFRFHCGGRGLAYPLGLARSVDRAAAGAAVPKVGRARTARRGG